MRIPFTLQRYIFREMGKTFLLTTVGLTGVFEFGGGVFNMIKLGEVTPGQFFRLMLLFLPLAAALTLPMAALFSAASTYGRISADNEFLACRSSGINIHILFLPAVVLSLASAGATFMLFNFVIPGMVHNLDRFVGLDLGTMIQQNLNRPKGLSLPGTGLGKKIRIHADDPVIDELNPNQIDIPRVAFMGVDGDEWVRFGTIELVRLWFAREGGKVTVSGKLIGLSFYDLRTGQPFEEAEQDIPPNVFELGLPARLKFLTLGELLHYWNHPTEWNKVREQLARVRFALAVRAVHDAIWDDWLDDKKVTLLAGDARYTIGAEQAGRTKQEGIVEFYDVTIEEIRDDRRIVIKAERAGFEIPRDDRVDQGRLQIEAYDVTLSDGGTLVHKNKDIRGPIPFPAPIVEYVGGLADDDLFGQAYETTDSDPLARARAKGREIRADAVRKITGIVHERLAFSVSVCFLVILGAGLGIIFRGSHVLTAFGISFVPLLFVIVAIVMGKQLSKDAATAGMGLAVLWSGIAVVALLDLVTLTKVLRR